MYPKRLKIKVFLTLALLLIIGMLLVDIVFVVLWQKDNQRILIESTETEVKTWGKKIKEKHGVGLPMFTSDLNELCQAIGPSCLEIDFLDEEGILRSKNIRDVWGLDELLLNAKRYDKRLVRFEDSRSMYLFLSERNILLVLPVFEGKPNKSYLGIVLKYKPFSEAIVHSQIIIALYIFINLIVLVTIGFFRIVELFIRPIQKLAQKVATYNIEDGDMFFSDKSGGEFRYLSNAIHTMLHRIDDDRNQLESTIVSLERANLRIISNQQEMIKTEKLATVGKISAGLAHEIGNPVGIIQGYVELLSDGEIKDEDRFEFSKRAHDELERINQLVRQLLDTTRSNVGKSEIISIHEILGNLIEMILLSKKDHKFSLESKFHCKHDLLYCNKHALHQVFLNCLFNAIDAVEEKGGDSRGKICITTENIKKNGKYKDIVVTIDDNGVGIEKEDLKNVLEPFFTTKKAGQGTGLGLAVSQNIVESLKGKLDIDSIRGVGSTVKISLPIKSSKICEPNETTDN